MSVPLENIEAVLTERWNERAVEGVAARVSTVNLVALCTEPARAEATIATAREMLRVHLGRALVVVLRDGTAGVEATAGLVCGAGDAGEVCGECIVLDVKGTARDWVPITVERLLQSGSRVHLWWIGDLPDDDTLYDRLTQIADVVTLNSEEMDLRDLATLARRVRESRGSHVLGDLNWTRLRPWQDLLARFFDDPSIVEHLAHARTLVLACTEHRRGIIEEPASTQAALFAAWFASRIGVDPRGATWSQSSGPRRDVSLHRADGVPFRVVFETVARADVYPGALVRVTLDTDDGAEFEVARQEDRKVLGWRGHSAHSVIPDAVVRLGEAGDASMLRAQLDRPVRDALFERSLETAAAMIVPLYARSKGT